MTQMMKAAVLHELRTPLKIEQVPVPEPGHGDLLIKVTACGVCHSDLHAVDGDWTPPPVIPLIPGHEVAGKVAKVGPGVTGFKVGDEVGVPWLYSACGHALVNRIYYFLVVFTYQVHKYRILRRPRCNGSIHLF